MPRIIEMPPLRQLAESAGAHFRGSGPNPASHCPLHHGDNPNAFHLYDHGRRWHCFTRCPPGQNDGDALRFLQLWQGKAPSLLDIPVCLADKEIQPEKEILDRSDLWPGRAEAFVSFAIDCLRHPETGARARRYLLHQRGLAARTCDLFRLGLNPTDLHDDPSRWGLEQDHPLSLPRGLVIPRYFLGRLLGVKIRRPQPGEPLAEVLPAAGAKAAKFISVRGSRHGLFGCDTWLGYPSLLLVEGEWDCMLAWQTVAGVGPDLDCDIGPDLDCHIGTGLDCDVATFCSASNGLPADEEIELYTYQHIFVVYDADQAGQQGQQRFASLPRAHLLTPPAHDLTDFHRSGGDLRLFLRQAIHSKPTPPSSPKFFAEKFGGGQEGVPHRKES